MTLLMRDQEKREEGFDLATRIIAYLKNHPSQKSEEVATNLSCTIDEVLKIRNLMSL